MKPFLSAFVAALLLSSATSVRAERVALVQVNGLIDPAKASYIACGIDQAASGGTVHPFLKRAAGGEAIKA